MAQCSVHFPHHLVDKLFPVPMITSLHEVVGLHPHSTCRTTQLKGPQEVVRLLEVLPNSEDFVDQILNANDSTGSQHLLDHLVVTDSNALVVHLSESSLVDQLSDGLQVGVSPRYKWLHQAQHVQRAFVEFYKHSVVDLSETKKLKSFLHFRAHLVHTTDSDDESQFSLSSNVEVAVTFGHASETDFISFLGTVFLSI